MRTWHGSRGLRLAPICYVIMGLLAPLRQAAAQGFETGNVHVSVFHRAGYGVNTSGFGSFGTDYIQRGFSWGNTFRQPDGPEITSGWAGFDLILSHYAAGYAVRNGTGIWQTGGNGNSPASLSFITSSTFFWRPDQPGQTAQGLISAHYILSGHVGSAPTDFVEFTCDVQFNSASFGTIPLHLHYKNSQPGSSFSGVDLYAEVPVPLKTVNGNSTLECDINENTVFVVTDPGDGSLSGVGNVGPVAAFAGASPTPPPIAQPARAQNIATRERVLNGENVLIGGFIVTGSEPKTVLIRGIGPATGLNGALADPTLELRDSSNQLLASNDNWKINDQTGQSQQAEIEATTIPPQNNQESAILITLPAASSAYTAIVRGKNGGTGVGLVEVYDISPDAGSQLANISTRGLVDVGQNVLIGGLIVGPGSSQSTSIVVRAIGPSLMQAGISNALADPTLELHNANGALLKTNDNWKIDDQTGQSQESQIRATQVPPGNDLESAIVGTLTPGGYTAIVAGKNGGVGVGLVEVYNLQ